MPRNTNKSPIDNDVKIPAAVRVAAARADELHKQTYETEPTPEEATEGAPPAGNPAEEPPASPPEPARSEPPVEGNHSAEPSQPQPDPGAPPEDWEHKFKSAQGRIDRLQVQNQQLSDRVRELEQVLATMSQPAPANPQPAPSPAKLLTPEEESEYGEEFLSVVAKKAREEFGPIVQQYEGKIKELESRLQGVTQRTAMSAREQMERNLDEKIPSWRDVNYDPNFLSWLRLPDPYSGVIRHSLLKQAYERNETSRVLAIFNGFLSEEAATAPQSAEPETPDGGVTTEGKIPLEALAAPGRARSAAAPSIAPAEKPIITRADIARFYTDVANGKYRGREEERARTERVIFEATREQRIQ